VAKAEELEKKADKKPVEEKPLPMLASPTVNLAMEMREAIAIRCRETGESFSLVTNKMWLDLLKKEKRVKADLAPDLTPKRGGGGGKMKAKLEEKDALIAELQKQLEVLKAGKR